MAGLTWTDLEEAVLTALQGELGSQVKTLETFQGDWLEALQRESWRLPAVLVMLNGSQAEQVTTRSYDLDYELVVLVLLRSLRGEAAGRRQAGGAYDLLEGVRRALWHQDLGLEILPWRLAEEEAWLNTPEYAVAAARYRTTAVQTF
jgi:phage gp37-like protein